MEKVNYWVRVYNSVFDIEHILSDEELTRNLTVVELYRYKEGGEGSASMKTINEALKNLKVGDIVFICRKEGLDRPCELIGIVRIVGEPKRVEEVDDKGIEWVGFEAEAKEIERFFDQKGNKIKEWRETWPEFEKILGWPRISFMRIDTESTYPSIPQKIQELLNAQKFRGDS